MQKLPPASGSTSTPTRLSSKRRSTASEVTMKLRTTFVLMVMALAALAALFPALPADQDLWTSNQFTMASIMAART